MRRNLLYLTDSYKYSQWQQYPPKLQRLYSYLETRGSDEGFEDIVFFGLQYYIDEYLTKPYTLQDIAEIDQACEEHFGKKGIFNKDGYINMYEDYGGFYPTTVLALPEGIVVPHHTPLFALDTDDKRYTWVNGILETLLVNSW